MDLVKLGGSVITDKGRECTLAQETLTRLAMELAASASKPLLLTHGAGSFGHIKARKGMVQHGLRDLREGEHLEERVSSMAVVQADVRRLNLAVTDIFNDAGIPLFSIPPAAVGKMREKKLVSMALGSFRDAVALGLSPVTFGDVVPDETMGFSICSGDQLMYLLAREFKVKRAVFVCDVDGVYDKDPKKNPDAKLQKRLTAQQARDMKLASSGEDVTGAMEGKLDWAVKIAELGVPVLFINGNVPGRVENVLSGKDDAHTLLEA
ncbi:MAG: isopentenyl phosphate kinase [Candidatus Thermoplasmatota archaeon]|nr:isopentenyl phosphate kinase [Candidatus Thermoplasmatota archaeon]